MGGYNKFKGDFFLFMIYFKLAFLFSIFASLPFPPIFLSVFQVLVVISFVNGLPMVGCEVEASGVSYNSSTFMFSSLDVSPRGLGGHWPHVFCHRRVWFRVRRADV